jgi:glutamate--cysteine ligase
VSDIDDPSTPPIRRDQLVEWFLRAEKKRGHLVGTEQEKFCVFVGDGRPVPARYTDHVRPVLEALVERFGWSPGRDRGKDGELVALARDGASITLEPGGQLELSGAPVPTVHATCAEFTRHAEELQAVGESLGISFLCCGFHPFATHAEIDWMPKGRYAVMREYLPTRGRRALDMMVRTCTVQANLDYADEAECGRRLRLLTGISALLTALFANSPYREGRATGLRSSRSEVWESVDPDRCGLIPWLFEEEFSYARWAAWALDVPMFFVRRDGRYLAHHATFAEFMRDGFVDPQGRRHHATRADWQLHLNTLFPEVRLNPYLEVRAPDSVGARDVCALPALCKGLVYDEEAGAGAWELVAELSLAERLELWREARTVALASPRIRAQCRTLVELARAGLDRIDARDTKGRTESRFLEPLDDLLDRGSTPADDALAALGPEPGTDVAGRIALVRHFRFAGAEP